MNRRQANRMAKSIFMSYGWQADVDWDETCDLRDIDDDDRDLVHDYFVRCADRVQDWLGT